MKVIKLKSKSRYNGEGSFYFDKAKERYYGVVTVGYTADNKPIRKKVSDKDFNAARKKFKELKAQIEAGTYVDKDDSLLQDVISSLIEKNKLLNLIGQTTYNRDLRTLKHIQRDPIGKMPIQSITDRDVLIFLNKKLDLSDSYLRKIWRQLNMAFNHAVAENIINRNPMAQLRRPKSKTPTKKIYALTLQEQKKLVETLSGAERHNKFSPVLRLMLLTGMRPGEALALDKDKDLNFNFKRITVRRTITRDAADRYVIGESTKTENGTRTIVMTDTCCDLLREILASWEPNPDNLLFYDNEHGNLINPCQLNSAFKRIVIKYGIIPSHKEFQKLSTFAKAPAYRKYSFYEKQGDEYKRLGKDAPQAWERNYKRFFRLVTVLDKPVSPHMLRHTFATRCIESGMPVKVLSKILGHADIETTLNTYCDVFENYENDAMLQAESYMQNMSLTG